MRQKIIVFFLSAFFYGQLSGQAYPERHSTSFTDAWLSCETSMNPNPTRGDSYWILYDFGEPYSLGNSKLWNYNVPGETNLGIAEVMVDYSMDSTTWLSLGTFDVAEAPGSTIYQGTDGPDFGGVNAQYVLITIVKTHGGDCAGISEWKIESDVFTNTTALQELDVDVDLHPNPASTYTDIQVAGDLGDYLFVISDIKGQVIQRGHLVNNRYRLNTSQFISGVYTIRIENEKGSSSLLLNVVSE